MNISVAIVGKGSEMGIERYKISEDDVAWGKIKLTGSGVHAKETLGV